MAHRSASVSNLVALEAKSRAAARSAGLRYTDDRRPGLRRERKRSAFSYFDGASKRVTDPRTLDRIRMLAIPPAWTDVWICPAETGHLQATGRDARGRKQYRYHRAWSVVRDAAKHSRMFDFACRLDSIREHCARVLATRGHTRDKVMAALLSVIDLTAIRVGHEEYTRDNASFGLTTLRTRHVRLRGSRVELRFRGKSGVQRTLSFSDPQLAKVIAACRALGGPQLFQYRDARGIKRSVDANQLNGYLRELIGESFSVKDFRTWAATVCVAVELRGRVPAASQRAAKKQLLEAIRTAAAHLGNTPTVCRNSYVHPLVMQSFMLGKTLPKLRVATSAEALADYRAHELAVRRFLQRLIKDRSSAASRATIKRAS